jgi:two-component SAPR family response regulator
LRSGRQALALEYAAESLRLIEAAETYQLYLDQGQRASLVASALVDAGYKSPFLDKVLRAQEQSKAPAMPGAAPITVRCLGKFRVLAANVEISPERWVSTKARDLLAYFVTFRGENVPLERAVNALWPEKDGGSKTAFHTALYRLRQALQSPGQSAKFILLEAGECRLDAARFAVDIDEFDALLSRAHQAPEQEALAFYHKALDLYEGEYLNNLYYDWLMPERRRLAQAGLSCLNSLADLYAVRGDYNAALEQVQRILKIDPLIEDAHCSAMRYQAALGDRNGLVRQYQALQQVLGDELHVEPMPGTRHLYASLLAKLSEL